MTGLRVGIAFVRRAAAVPGGRPGASRWVHRCASRRAAAAAGASAQGRRGRRCVAFVPAQTAGQADGNDRAHARHDSRSHGHGGDSARRRSASFVHGTRGSGTRSRRAGAAGCPRRLRLERRRTPCWHRGQLQRGGRVRVSGGHGAVRIVVAADPAAAGRPVRGSCHGHECRGRDCRRPTPAAEPSPRANATPRPATGALLGIAPGLAASGACPPCRAQPRQHAQPQRRGGREGQRRDDDGRRGLACSVS